jgi:hypothetical protein
MHFTMLRDKRTHAMPLQKQVLMTGFHCHRIVLMYGYELILPVLEAATFTLQVIDSP